MSALSVGCEGTGRLFAEPAEELVDTDYDGGVIVLTGLRPCPSASGYARPLLVSLTLAQPQVAERERRDGEEQAAAPLVEVPFAGMPWAHGGADLPLYLGAGVLAQAEGQRVQVAIDACPALLDDPAASLRCTERSRLRTITLRVPKNGRGWRRVHDVSLRAPQCISLLSE